MYSLRETGIRWIGSIPEGWQLEKVKRLFFLSKEKAHQSDPVVLSLARSGVKIRDISTNEGQMAESYYDYNPVKPGDLLLNTMDLYSGDNCNVSHVNGVISPAYANLRSFGDANPEYYNYFFKIQYIIKALFAHGKGVSHDNRWTLNNDTLLNYIVPVPPREEQDQIVRYLDWQISKINKLIRGYKQEILLVKERAQSEISSAVLLGLDKDVRLKPAGLQNIDFIPEHWRILQNKRIFAERTELSTTGTETLLSVSKHYGVKPYAELSDSEQYATIKPAESLVGYKKVKRHDVAMNIMRARNGSYGVSEYEGIVSSAYAVFKPIIECNPRYMHYLLKTPQVIGIFESYSYGIAEHRRRLYAVDFLRLHLPVPPVEEQNDIARHIERVQARAQNAIVKIQNEIDLLREYRTRLISDVVTGQMDVRGIEIPDYTIEEDIDEIIDTDDMTDEEVYADAE